MRRVSSPRTKEHEGTCLAASLLSQGLVVHGLIGAVSTISRDRSDHVSEDMPALCPVQGETRPGFGRRPRTRTRMDEEHDEPGRFLARFGHIGIVPTCHELHRGSMSVCSYRRTANPRHVDGRHHEL
jgi:hypothetical protein